MTGDGDRERFLRQVRFAPLGEAGQERLARSRVLLVGCGALGGVLAQSLVRVGVGTLVIVDRDVVELTNLPRQVLFEDAHAREGTPKALAAAQTLARIGGPTRVEPRIAHVDAPLLPELAAGADLLLDGTDNLATRYLLNDWSVREGVPWVYGGVVGSGGLVLPVLPGTGACLRCLFPDPPAPGTLPTCETAGVILPAVSAIASLQAGLAVRILGGAAPPSPALLSCDVWSGELRRLEAPRREGCPTCSRRLFPFLEDPPERETVTLCGRNTVQVRGRGAPPSLEELADRLAPGVTDLVRGGPFLRFEAAGLRLTLFADGRALVEGTEDGERALAFYDRFVG